jgi:hypothetical protein
MFGFGKKKTPEQPTQSQSISNASVSGQVAQAGRDLNQVMQSSQSQSEQQISATDAAELLGQVLSIVNNSPSLSEPDKAKAISSLEAAKVAVTEPEPDKSYISGSLQRTIDAIRSASDIYNLTKPLLDQVLLWTASLNP